MPGLIVEHLWKRFRLKPPPGSRGGEPDHLWALQDLDFKVSRGGALGVIGSNGSGKSTLLQCVAGVLQPTAGSVRARGRVIAVLNPTAGFHPDLTGRANIQMLGSLHGITRAHLKTKLDPIIEFSGLGGYIDQPLRTYSAGMMIRLGVSTAGHLEPDVLVVDEVLSAGDLAFQRQAAGMVRHLRQQGVSVLLSTHALGDLAALCDRLLLIERGRVRSEGSAEEVVASYLQRVDAEGSKICTNSPVIAGARPTSPGKDVVIRGVVVNGARDADVVALRCGDPLEITLEYEAEQPVDDPVFRVQFFRNDGLFVHGQNTTRHGVRTGRIDGKGSATLRYERFGLLGGDYYLSVGIWPDEYRSYTTGEAFDHRPSAGIVRVAAARSDGAGVAGFPCRWEL